MLGKLGIFVTIVILVFLFFIVISYGAGLFSKGEKNPQIKKAADHAGYLLQKLTRLLKYSNILTPSLPI